MLPIHKIIWHEWSTKNRPIRQNEPEEIMNSLEQVKSYVHAYEWGGPTSSLQLHHLRELSYMIKPGDTVLDLACGPGALLLELAVIYPESHFIGADLSGTMLEYLKSEAKKRNLKNVSVLLEDVSKLPSLDNKKVDVVISTSALHHLPSEIILREVFKKINTLLKKNGGFYIFDFGQLKSHKSREFCVAEVAKLAKPITVRDYELSLQATYPIDEVFKIGMEELPKPFTAFTSSFVDFFFFLQTPYRTKSTEKVQVQINELAKKLTFSMNIENKMLRMLRRQKRFA